MQSYLEEEVKHLCRKHGYIETLSGRRRYLPEIRSGDEKKRAAACRQAVNSTVQGSAADLIKQARMRTLEPSWKLPSLAPSLSCCGLFLQAMLRIDDELTASRGPALHSARDGRLLLQVPCRATPPQASLTFADLR